jgi:hypothetical protein
MSIFPIGTIFCIFALIISYFLEILHLGYYKRPEEISGKLCCFFLINFKFVISVFAIGNYIFLYPIRDIYKVNWSLINLIIFIIIAFIPYHSFRFNFLGIKEGEAIKGSYEEYSLMFPTDYEKENPLTKSSAMIKHFKKLEAMNIIDKYQSEYLINNIKKESAMDNYYKTSKNVGNILKSYEFQRQFVKLKRKYKFIKEVRRNQELLNKYNVNMDNEYIRRAFTFQSKKSSFKQRSENKATETENTINNAEKKFQAMIKNSVHFINKDKYMKKGANSFMRQTLINRIKDEGIDSDSEEESEEDNDICSSNSENIGHLKKINDKNSQKNVIKEEIIMKKFTQ